MAAIGPFSLDRAVSAVEKVRERLLKAAAALRDGGVAYAVIGGHAVALTALCDKDRTPLRDLIDAGLLTAEWLPKLPPGLAARLGQLLDTPDG